MALQSYASPISNVGGRKSYYLEKLIASKAETLFYVFIESLARSFARLLACW